MQESSYTNRYFFDGELIAKKAIFSFVLNMFWVKNQTGGGLFS